MSFKSSGEKREGLAEALWWINPISNMFEVEKSRDNYNTNIVRDENQTTVI